MNRRNSSLSTHRTGVETPKKKQEFGQGHRRSALTLYIWFHGLFGFYFKKDHIVVVTPFMEEHKYFAGSWMQESPIKAGEWYRLRGVTGPQRPATPPAIDPAKDAVLSGISKVDMDSSYFLTRLDFPKQIIPVRYVNATFAGRASSQLHAPFPLVHLFEYEIPDPDCLNLEPLEWKPKRSAGSLTTNLHVFAEPQEIVPNEHAMHAFMSLVSMFPGIDLQLQDSTYRGCIPLDLNSPHGNLPCGLDPREELSLAERGKSGTQPANCFGLIGQP